MPASAHSPPPAPLRFDVECTPVNTINCVPYLLVGRWRSHYFARQVFKLTNRKGITGESMAIEAKVLVDKWAARGLNPDVLVAIRFENFSIAEPKP